MSVEIHSNKPCNWQRDMQDFLEKIKISKESEDTKIQKLFKAIKNDTISETYSKNGLIILKNHTAQNRACLFETDPVLFPISQIIVTLNSSLAYLKVHPNNYG